MTRPKDKFAGLSSWGAGEDANSRIRTALSCALGDARREKEGIESCLHLDTDIIYAGIFPFTDIRSLVSVDEDTSSVDRLLIGTLWSQGILGHAAVLPFHDDELEWNLYPLRSGGGISVTNLESHIWDILGDERTNSLQRLSETVTAAIPNEEQNQANDRARKILNQLMEIGPEAFVFINALTLGPRHRAEQAVQYIRPSIAKKMVQDSIAIAMEPRFRILLEEERPEDRNVQSQADARALASLIGSWKYTQRNTKNRVTPIFVTGSPSVRRALDRAPEEIGVDEFELGPIWEIDNPEGPFRSLEYLLIRTMYGAVSLKDSAGQWKKGPSRDDLERFGEYVLRLQELKTHQKEHSVARFLDHILQNDYDTVHRTEACRHLLFSGYSAKAPARSVGPWNVQANLRANTELSKNVNNQLSRKTAHHLSKLQKVFESTMKSLDFSNVLCATRSGLQYTLSTEEIELRYNLHDHNNAYWVLSELGLACYYPLTEKNKSTSNLLRAIGDLILAGHEPISLRSAADQIAHTAISIERSAVVDRILCGLCEYLGLWSEAFHFEFLAHTCDRVPFDSTIYWYTVSRLQDTANAEIMRRVCGIDNELDRLAIVRRVLDKDDSLDIRACELGRMLLGLWLRRHKKKKTMKEINPLKEAAEHLLNTARGVITSTELPWASRFELAARCSHLSLLSSEPQNALSFATYAESLLLNQEQDQMATAHTRLIASVRALLLVDVQTLNAIFRWHHGVQNENNIYSQDAHPLMGEGIVDIMKDKLDGGLLNNKGRTANYLFDPTYLVSKVLLPPQHPDA